MRFSNFTPFLLLSFLLSLVGAFPINSATTTTTHSLSPALQSIAAAFSSGLDAAVSAAHTTTTSSGDVSPSLIAATTLPAATSSSPSDTFGIVAGFLGTAIPAAISAAREAIHIAHATTTAAAPTASTDTTMHIPEPGFVVPQVVCGPNQHWPSCNPEWVSHPRPWFPGPVMPSIVPARRDVEEADFLGRTTSVSAPAPIGSGTRLCPGAGGGIDITGGDHCPLATTVSPVSATITTTPSHAIGIRICYDNMGIEHWVPGDVICPIPLPRPGDLWSAIESMSKHHATTTTSFVSAAATTNFGW